MPLGWLYPSMHSDSRTVSLPEYTPTTILSRMRVSAFSRLFTLCFAFLAALSQPAGALAHGLAHEHEHEMREAAAATTASTPVSMSLSAADHDDALLGDANLPAHHPHAVLHGEVCARLTLAAACLASAPPTIVPAIVRLVASRPTSSVTVAWAAEPVGKSSRPRDPPIA